MEERILGHWTNQEMLIWDDREAKTKFGKYRIQNFYLGSSSVDHRTVLLCYMVLTSKMTETVEEMKALCQIEHNLLCRKFHYFKLAMEPYVTDEDILVKIFVDKQTS